MLWYTDWPIKHILDSIIVASKPFFIPHVCPHLISCVYICLYMYPIFIKTYYKSKALGFTPFRSTDTEVRSRLLILHIPLRSSFRRWIISVDLLPLAKNKTFNKV